MIDICSLFGFDEVEIFRYYLLKDRRLMPDMDNDKTNDHYQFHYKTIVFFTDNYSYSFIFISSFYIFINIFHIRLYLSNIFFLTL